MVCIFFGCAWIYYFLCILTPFLRMTCVTISWTACCFAASLASMRKWQQKGLFMCFYYHLPELLCESSYQTDLASYVVMKSLCVVLSIVGQPIAGTQTANYFMLLCIDESKEVSWLLLCSSKIRRKIRQQRVTIFSLSKHCKGKEYLRGGRWGNTEWLLDSDLIWCIWTWSEKLLLIYFRAWWLKLGPAPEWETVSAWSLELYVNLQSKQM